MSNPPPVPVEPAAIHAEMGRLRNATRQAIQVARDGRAHDRCAIEQSQIAVRESLALLRRVEESTSRAVTLGASGIEHLSPKS